MAAFIFDIVNEDGTSIECKGKGYFVEKNTWSGEYSSEYQQLTSDHEDAGWCGAGTAFPSGNTTLFWLYTDTEACCFIQVSNGSSDYTGVRQLLPSQPPQVTLTVSDGTVNNQINATQSSSDQYQWIYDSVTHHHRDSWYGQALCPMVGINKVEYDWGDGSGFTENDSTHTYTAVGDYTITVRVTNPTGQIAEDSKVIRVAYNEPTINLSNDPIQPIIDQDTTITVDILDSDSRETNRKYYIDGVETVDLTHAFSTLGTHEFTVEIYWNDGFEDKVTVETLVIELANQAPTIAPEYTVTGDNSELYNLTFNAVDPEDDLAYVKVNVYVDTSNMVTDATTAPVWVLVESINVVDPTQTVSFYDMGSYKIDMQAFDGDGLSSTIESITVDIGACSDTGSSTGDGDTSDGTNSIDANENFVNNGFNTFSFLGRKNSYFDNGANAWVEDAGVEATAEDLAKAITARYGLVWDNEEDPQWIGNYVKYLRTYDETAGKIRYYKPAKTPYTNEANFPLMVRDELDELQVRGISMYLLQTLDTVAEQNGAVVVFRGGI